LTWVTAQQTNYRGNDQNADSAAAGYNSASADAAAIFDVSALPLLSPAHTVSPGFNYRFGVKKACYDLSINLIRSEKKWS
jgi:hypothetical protein